MDQQGQGDVAVAQASQDRAVIKRIFEAVDLPISDRDFNILADSMFYPSGFVAKRHNLNEYQVLKIRSNNSRTFARMLEAKKTILQGFLQAGLYEGLGKVLTMIERVETTVVKPDDVTRMTRAMLDLTHIMTELDSVKGNGEAKNKGLKTLSDQAEKKLTEIIDVESKVA